MIQSRYHISHGQPGLTGKWFSFVSMSIRKFIFYVVSAVVFTACATNTSMAEPSRTAQTAIPQPTRTSFVEPTPTLPPCQQPETPTATIPPTQQPEPLTKVESWPVSSPEEQGMDPSRLAGLLEAIQSGDRNIHSVLVARHGTMVLEAYFPPFDRETPHNMYSCTKSVTSAAVGLCMRDEQIDSLNTPIYTYFPDVQLDNENRKAITIYHLLTMSSGLEWSEPLRSGLNDNWYIFDSDNPAEYFLSRPTVTVPGRLFNYNTGGSHLLSMIVQEEAGESMADLVERKLFTPLGITRYEWIEDTSGHTIGGTGLALAPADMLRFGQLYLQYGLWGTDVVLTTDWVRESTRSHMELAGGVNYGYQWWVRSNGVYNALGWGGQQIIVIPKQDMVVVFTAGIRDASWNTYDDLLETYIIPSAVSNSTLPPDPSGTAQLKEQLLAVADEEPVTPSILPSTAHKVSGKTYVDLNGTHGWSTFTFDFSRSDEVDLEFVYGDKSEEITACIGLDGIYRVSPTKHFGPVAFKGRWIDENTFELTQQFLMEAERIEMELTFLDDGIKRVSRFPVGNHTEESDAVLLFEQ